MNSNRTKVIYYFIRPYIVEVVLLGFLILGFAALEGVSLALLFHVLQSTFAEDAVRTGWVASLIDRLIALMPTQDDVISGCLLLIITIGVKNIIGYYSQMMSASFGYKIWEDNQIKLYRKYIKSDYLNFLNQKQGEILYRIYSAPNSLGHVLTMIPQMLVEFVKMAVVLAVLFSLAFGMTVVVLIFCVTYYLFTRYVARNISYNLGRGRVDAGERQTVLISEMCSGFRQIKLFDARTRWANEFRKAVRDYFTLAIKDSMWLAMPKHFLDFCFMAGLAAILIIVKLTNPTGFLSLIPLMGGFAYSFLRVMPSLNMISSQGMQVMSVLPNLEIIRNILEEDYESVKNGEVRFQQLKEGIHFENVAFSYPGRTAVLNNVSVEFVKGQQTAIVGPSGSGKTTIADLLTRLFDPNSGRILIDGVDLRVFDVSTWLEKIAYVSQDTFVFHSTIAENIAFGRSGVTKAEIEEAARVAHAHEFILELPDGYNTIVGDRGLKLSGGQRQRLAIARAILRKPEIIILDEATSALDSASEAVVQKAIGEIAKDRTVIMIAHRLSTVHHVDKIIVFAGGNVVEQGTHDELIKRGGIYHNLYSLQIKSRNAEHVA